MSRNPTDWGAKSRHAAGTPDVTTGGDSETNKRPGDAIDRKNGRKRRRLMKESQWVMKGFWTRILSSIVAAEVDKKDVQAG